MSLHHAPSAKIEVVENGDVAECSMNGRRIIRARRNAHGYWVVELPIGRRYYSNPTPCAIDWLVARNITRDEADRQTGMLHYRVRNRNGRVSREYY